MPYVFVMDAGVERYFEQRAGLSLERYAACQECYFLAGLEGTNLTFSDVSEY